MSSLTPTSASLLPDNDGDIQTIDQAIARLSGLIGLSMEFILRAADIYVRFIDAVEDGEERFRRAVPTMKPSAWSELERIGRREIDPRLWNDRSPAGKYLKRLPYSQQRAALDHGVQLYIKGNEGDDHLIVDTAHLTGLQIKQVFAGDRVRTLPEQRCWLESQEAQDARSVRHRRVPYRIVNNGRGKVVVSVEAGTVMDETLLAKLLQRVRDEAKL